MRDNLLLFILVGFCAQIVDGALGMAYGVSANSFLLTLGVAPAAASASVHTSEIFTTFASGISHFKLGNVDAAMFRRLVLPGVLGGAAGAYALSELPGGKIQPLVALYLLLMGLYILRKAVGRRTIRQAHTPLTIVGLIAGFFDATGGGGWGPIVTTTLVGRGQEPRMTIGSVNLAEFFVTSSTALTFILTVKLTNWQVIVGLLIGGMLAAPLAAFGARRLPARTMLILVSGVIILLSLRMLILAL